MTLSKQNYAIKSGHCATQKVAFTAKDFYNFSENKQSSQGQKHNIYTLSFLWDSISCTIVRNKSTAFSEQLQRSAPKRQWGKEGVRLDFKTDGEIARLKGQVLGMNFSQIMT